MPVGRPIIDRSESGERSRARYARRKRYGRCVSCDGSAVPGRILCLRCQRKYLRSQRAMVRRRAKLRQCRECGKPSTLFTLCLKHRLKKAQRPSRTKAYRRLHEYPKRARRDRGNGK